MGKYRREGLMEGIPELSFEGKMWSDGVGKHFWVMKPSFTKLDYEGKKNKGRL